MNSQIIGCTKEMVISYHGKEKWNQVLACAGEVDRAFQPSDAIEEATLLKVFDAVCAVLKISFFKFSELFGDYWVNVYTRKMYGALHELKKTSRDILLDLLNVRSPDATQKETKHAGFSYEWLNEKTLVLQYQQSNRAASICIALLHSAGAQYANPVEINTPKVGEMEIVFC